MAALKTHCGNGHEFTPQNTYICVDRDGCVVRHCRTCNSIRKKLRYESDPKIRAVAKAYSRWWRCGDPKGRSWSEVRAEVLAGAAS